MAEPARAVASIGRWSAPPLRPVVHLISMMVTALGILMVVPAAVDLSVDHPDWRAFALSALLTLAAGGTGLYVTRETGFSTRLNLRQAFVLTPFSWLVVSLFGAIPLAFSRYGPLAGSFTNAFFESMSGLTTTGSTVLVGLDAAPPGVLIWRALLQWLGGIGIIGTAIAILPALGVGGMQLFRTESSDRSEKALPRVRQIAVGVFAVYIGLTALCALLYWRAGMTPFDAAAHALTTVSTGGYSTSDGSLGNWDSAAIHWIATLFMLAGGIPFVLYVRLLRGERRALWDHQVRTLLAALAVIVAGLTGWLAIGGDYTFADALRLSAFNVVSVVTTTGYATADYLLWGNFAVGLFFGLTFVGGCTGSTAGGIKIFRFEVMAVLLRTHFLQLLYPRGVFPRSYAGKPLTDDVVRAVAVFFSLFFLSYAGFTIALMAMELDFLTSSSAAVTALANVGPGIGPIIGPSGNFTSLPAAAKWLLCFAMLLGRLELFTVLVLFMPRFWRG